MVAGGARRLLLIAASIFIVIIFGFYVRSDRITTWPTANAPAVVSSDYFNQHDYTPDDAKQESNAAPSTPAQVSTPEALVPEVIAPISSPPASPSKPPSEQAKPNTKWDENAYVVVSSRMTHDKKWFPIDFGDYGSYNPNLIPHPWRNQTWIMIAQGKQADDEVKGVVYSLELVCDAVYIGGKMQCRRSPTTVPVASTISDHCTGELEWFNYFIGPNDPRVFFGPDRPYITYGSASQYTCLGQWIHDLRRLVHWDEMSALNRTNRFFWPTELQRPPPYGPIEKNWFAFWDSAGEMYLHYNMHPSRSFARVSEDGSKVSEDLAPVAAAKDDVCIQKYMPTLGTKEHIHQATNSLAVTMCLRADTTCDVSKNTFIFTIFHHKQYHGHNLYEPYIMMFEQSAPFNVHAISSKPFWINGREKPGEGDPDRPGDQSQMMYITSMSWKERGVNYHGYMDDELMISFGIEDKAAGGIDVVAQDLIREMHLC